MARGECVIVHDRVFELRQGWGGPLTVALRVTGDVLRSAAQRRGEQAALFFPEARLSYAELDRLANRFANALLQDGVGRGARVALMCRNGAHYAIAHFGAARAGCVAVHLSPRFTARELADALAPGDVACILGDAAACRVLEEAAARLPRLPEVVRVGDPDPGGGRHLDDLLRDQPETDPGVPVHPEDPLCVQFTSGTTGHPRGALIAHGARVLSAVAAVADYPLSADDVVALTTPMCHAAGLFTWFQPAVLAAARIVVLPRWDPGRLLGAVAEHAVTGVFLVPTQLAMLLDEAEGSDATLASLRLAVVGGAPVRPELVERFARALPWARLARAYGMTETGHLLSRVPERTDDADSYDHPQPGIEIEVFTAPGRPAAAGETGEVATRGAHLMRGYVDDPEGDAEFFRSGDGWGWTGDLGVKDREGRISLVGRRKELIISGGVNIHPAELEEALASHPDVAECAVFGIDDERWGERPAAAVVVRPGRRPSEADLLSHSARGVAPFKRVRSIFFVDALPRTGGGKVRRRLLKARFSG